MFTLRLSPRMEMRSQELQLLYRSHVVCSCFSYGRRLTLACSLHPIYISMHINLKMPEENVKTYTFEEIAEHSTDESAWIVIDNDVYDVTKFLEEHPGGPEILLDWAGQEDATDAFEDAGHSSDAREQLKSYKIGEIAEEERNAKPKTNGTSRCCRLGLLIPVSVVLAGLVIYAVIRLRK